jgi:hypothetical protein
MAVEKVNLFKVFVRKSFTPQRLRRERLQTQCKYTGDMGAQRVVLQKGITEMQRY